MRIALVGLLLAVGVTSAGCVHPPPEATYDVVPDAELYAAVADLPGVVKVDLTWLNTFAHQNEYLGEVYVRRRSDRCRVLDHTIAILRQGVPEANYSVYVTEEPPSDHAGGVGLSMYDVDPDLDIGRTDEDRYGPQPGDGEPPDDKLCRRKPGENWDPVPDEKMFAQVAHLPGVLGADLRYVEATNRDIDHYRGYVFVRRQRDWCRVLDQTYALLWRGEPGAEIRVVVIVGPPTPSPGPGFTLERVDHAVAEAPRLRYGEQPGTGRPPDDAFCRVDRHR